MIRSSFLYQRRSRVIAEYQDIVSDFIDFLTIRQSNRDKTLKVIEDADNGIDLSEPFDNVDDLMEALNA